MLDHYQKCPYCEKKTCYLVIGYIGEPGGDEVRCYYCKRQWLTDWARLTKHTKESPCQQTNIKSYSSTSKESS